MKSVSPTTIEFVLPPALTSAADGSIKYPMVINVNGTVFKTTMTIMPARPDIFTFSAVPGPGGRAKVYNVTNRVARTEPFTVQTIMIRGARRVPSKMRIYLTGVTGNIGANLISVRIGSQSATATSVPTLVEPGVYTVDFTMPTALNGAGDQPVVVTVTINGVTFQSRLDDTAPRIFIL